MKLAPPANTLQPLPPDVQPAVSQNVQRTASPADLQTIQVVQEQQSGNSSAAPTNPLPVTPYAPTSPLDSAALWIALAVAAIVAGGIAWLWRTF